MCQAMRYEDKADDLSPSLLEKQHPDRQTKASDFSPLYILSPAVCEGEGAVGMSEAERDTDTEARKSLSELTSEAGGTMAARHAGARKAHVRVRRQGCAREESEEDRALGLQKRAE